MVGTVAAFVHRIEGVLRPETAEGQQGAIGFGHAADFSAEIRWGVRVRRRAPDVLALQLGAAASLGFSAHPSKTQADTPYGVGVAIEATAVPPCTVEIVIHRPGTGPQVAAVRAA